MADNWQDRLSQEIRDHYDKEQPGVNVLLLNPRRDNWDSSWEQDISNPQFKEQVGWELAGIQAANGVFFYFDPNTKSPISLLELGLVARTGDKAFVCCPKGYWKRGNVEVLCNYYDITLVDTLEEVMTQIKEDIQ